MAHRPPTSLPSLEQPIDVLLRTGNVHALKTVLVDYGLQESFADYLITLFNDSLPSTDLASAVRDLMELVHEFVGNSEEQQAVMALLPRFQP